jgi:hypothetical protein
MTFFIASREFVAASRDDSLFAGFKPALVSH